MTSAEGGVTVSGRFGNRPFVGLHERVEVARLVVVQEGAVVMDHIVPAPLAAIAESEPLRDADERIEARRMHPVATEIEGLPRDEVLGPGTAPDAVRCLEKDERQAVGCGGFRGGKSRRAGSHDDDIDYR